ALMKKYFLVSVVCAAAILLCAVALMKAQGEGETAQGGRASAAAIPQLPFHLVENFFHYPANSVVGRTTGVAINPKTGNIVTLNRGYHPVLDVKSDGSFVSSWGEGSPIFVVAHVARFVPAGKL